MDYGYMIEVRNYMGLFRKVEEIGRGDCDWRWKTDRIEDIDEQR